MVDASQNVPYPQANRFRPQPAWVYLHVVVLLVVTLGCQPMHGPQGSLSCGPSDCCPPQKTKVLVIPCESSPASHGHFPTSWRTWPLGSLHESPQVEFVLPEEDVMMDQMPIDWHDAAQTDSEPHFVDVPNSPGD